MTLIALQGGRLPIYLPQNVNGLVARPLPLVGIELLTAQSSCLKLDVISSVAVDYVGVDVPTPFGESGLNSGRII